MATRILLADDHEMIRQGLKLLLERSPDLQVVGEASDGRGAIEAVAKLHPDVVVMDLSMPNLNGVDATRRIRGEWPDVRVVILSAYNDRERIAEALRAGASGYLLKASAYEELVTAVRSAVLGETYLGAGVSNGIPEAHVKAPANGDGRARLSDREREVLQLLAEGKAMKEAAAALHLSTKTVETHRRSIMGKLNLHSIAELTKHAIREGLTTLEH